MAMKRYKLALLALCCCGGIIAQTLDQAKKWFADGEFEKAKPVFKRLVRQAPSNANYNFWYGACCYETGELQESLPYLEKSSARKVINAYLYLSKAYCDLYRFDEAIKSMEDHIYWMKRKKRDTSSAEKLMQKYRMGARMIRGVENVTVVDSFVVDKDAFLNAYKLSKAAGQIGLTDDGKGTYYTNEWEDRMIFTQTDQEGRSRLLSCVKLGNEWSDPQPLDGLETEECSRNYPFINSDGITLYFASEGDESIGGYDIFVTRYSPEDDSYLKPDNIGFPFNSLYNDYMYVIDDLNGLGWFASDRYQPEGKVCVYVFVPNTSKVVYDYDSTDHARIRSLAMLADIKDTQNDTDKLNTARQNLAKAIYGHEQEQKQKRTDFEFIVNDNHVYHLLSDFRSAEAQELFRTLRQKEKHLEELEKTLAGLRDDYAASSDRNAKERLSSGILDDEAQVKELYEEIDALTLQVRNTEIKALDNH